MFLIAIDNFLIKRIYQPIVDRLANWKTHYQLAVLSLRIGSGLVLVLEVVIGLKTGDALTLLAVGAGSIVLLNVWIRDAIEYRKRDIEEKAGYFRPLSFGDWLQRIVILSVFILGICPLNIVYLIVFGDWLLNVLQMVAFLFAVSGYYFAACNPGRPKPKQAKNWNWGMLPQPT